jgi:hypothetical protein
MATTQEPGFPAPERAAESAPPPRQGLGAGRVTAIVLGAIGVLLGLGLTTAGVVALVYQAAQRDADGYVFAPDDSVSTETYAITSEGVDIHLGGVPDWIVNAESLGTIRVNAVSEDGEELFVGIAPEAEVDAFLADVAHEEFTSLGGRGTAIAGDTEAGLPDDVDIWAASATSTDTATVTWSMEDGRWALVVMNADASPGVAVDMTVGARIDWLDELGIGLLIAGVLLLGVGVLAIVLAARTPVGR